MAEKPEIFVTILRNARFEQSISHAFSIFRARNAIRLNGICVDYFFHTMSSSVLLLLVTFPWLRSLRIPGAFEDSAITTTPRSRVQKERL